jgi:hypothetical protein
MIYLIKRLAGFFSSCSLCYLWLKKYEQDFHLEDVIPIAIESAAASFSWLPIIYQLA